MPRTYLLTCARPTLPPGRPLLSWPHGWGWRTGLALALALAAGLPGVSRAAPEQVPAMAAPKSPTATRAAAAASATAKSIGEQVREAVQGGSSSASQNLTLMINGKEKKYITLPGATASPPASAPPHPAPIVPAEVPAKAAARRPAGAAAHPAAALPAVAVVNPQASRQYIRARAATLSARGAASTASAMESGADWRYEGINGPQAWGKLSADYALCARGQRQSPINIDQSTTLQGPAEPLQLNYQPSGASVVNNGHTIQVNVVGDNRLHVRGTSYKLQQISFHHPSEVRVNGQGFAMTAQLLHKSDDGQLAVLSVLLQSGAANALINKVWTYMPLDIGDRVPMPAGLLDLNELLPQDQRYYQFMGSLSTPPCTEGVLWLVLKQPAALSPPQIKLFGQLFPNNARPVQPVNGRAVRDAQ